MSQTQSCRINDPLYPPTTPKEVMIRTMSVVFKLPPKIVQIFWLARHSKVNNIEQGRYPPNELLANERGSFVANSKY